MADILGIGATHYPPGLVPEELKPWPLVRMLKSDPRIPERMKDPANWPEPLRAEWGDDEGIAAHKVHKARIFDAFRKIRREIEAFEPDFILMWGDDQYENFKEDIIPPFCVLAYEQLVFKPYERLRGRPNIWGEPADKVFTHPGHHKAGRYVARRLLEEGIDMSYAYKPLHESGLGHAFANTLLYLDLDRKGFNIPVVPVAVNCYGSSVIRFRGGSADYTKEPDPPSPSPRRATVIAMRLPGSPSWNAVCCGVPQSANAAASPGSSNPRALIGPPSGHPKVHGVAARAQGAAAAFEAATSRSARRTGSASRPRRAQASTTRTPGGGGQPGEPS